MVEKANRNNHKFLNSIIFKYNMTGRYLEVTFNFYASSKIVNNSIGFFLEWGEKKFSLTIAF